MMRAVEIVITLGLCITLLVGCFATGDYNKRPSQSSGYTIDEIISKGTKNNRLDDNTAEDISDKALKAYNFILGYTENIVHQDYKVFDFYYSQYTDSYVIKIIIGDEVESAEKVEQLATSDVRVIMLSCNSRATALQSGIETHLMARKLSEDLGTELLEGYPDYHLNSWYINLDYICPKSYNGKYDDPSDYTYYYKEDFYDSKIKFYENTVNVIIPCGVNKEDAVKIKEDIKSILKKYYITSVNIVCPRDDTAYDNIIENEKISGNNYLYDKDNVEWVAPFNVYNE